MKKIIISSMAILVFVILAIIVVKFTLGPFSSLSSEELVTHKPGGPYYYQSYANDARKPFQPIEELTKQQVEELKERGYAYYEAYYNNDGHITKFIKYYNDQIMFQEEYTYDGGELKDVVMIR